MLLFINVNAPVVKLADTQDLGSCALACRFKSCQAHQNRKRRSAPLFVLLFPNRRVYRSLQTHFTTGERKRNEVGSVVLVLVGVVAYGRGRERPKAMTEGLMDLPISPSSLNSVKNNITVAERMYYRAPVIAAPASLSISVLYFITGQRKRNADGSVDLNASGVYEYVER